MSWHYLENHQALHCHFEILFFRKCCIICTFENFNLCLTSASCQFLILETVKYWHHALKSFLFIAAGTLKRKISLCISNVFVNVIDLISVTLKMIFKADPLPLWRFPAACLLEKPSRMKKSLILLLLLKEHECGYLLLYWMLFTMVVPTAERHFTQLTLSMSYCTLKWCSTLYWCIQTG